MDLKKWKGNVKDTKEKEKSEIFRRPHETGLKLERFAKSQHLTKPIQACLNGSVIAPLLHVSV